MFVGRGHECDVVLDDPLVSRRHAVLFTERDGVLVEDLGSRNGTLVNGIRIDAPVSLADGDRVTIGAHSFLLALSTPRSSRPPARVRASASGSYERPPSTMRPPPPQVVDEVTRSISIFGMLIATCERALARGDASAAESAAANLAVSIRAELLRGRAPEPLVMNELVRFFLELAELTGSMRWVDRVLDLFGTARRVLDAATIDRIHRLANREGWAISDSVAQYLERVRAGGARISEDEDRLLDRLNELAVG